MPNQHNKKLEKKPSLFWAIIDLFVNIITAIAVIVLVAQTIKGVTLFCLVIIFLVWAFRPFILVLRNYLSKG